MAVLGLTVGFAKRPHEMSRLADSRFSALLASRAISTFGTAISNFAIPTMAVVLFRASPIQVGLLSAANTIAFPLLGVPIGMLVDRVSRRQLLVVADLLRFVVLLAVIALLLLHLASMAILAFASFLIGTGDVLFTVASQAYLPSILPRENIAQGNSRLEVGATGGQLLGASLAGSLLQFCGAAFALSIDGATYIVSALCLYFSGNRVPRQEISVKAPSFADFAAGLLFLKASSALRPLLISTICINIGFGMVAALLLPYAYNALHLAPAPLSLTLAIGNIAFLGALRSQHVFDRFGVGRSLAISAGLLALTTLSLPLATFGLPLVIFFSARAVASYFGTISNIAGLSIRQASVPAELQGRVHAAARSIGAGAIPVGAVAGGFIGTWFGFKDGFVIAGLIQALAIIAITVSPIRDLRNILDISPPDERPS